MTDLMPDDGEFVERIMRSAQTLALAVHFKQPKEAQDALRSALRLEVQAALSHVQPKGTPAGHKVVPYEPTQAMLTAAKDIDPALPLEHVRRLWWLMWGAAPRADPSAGLVVALRPLQRRRWGVPPN